MNKVLCFALLALVLVCLFSETEGWGRRRRRRFPCNWNRWNSWSFNCNTRCTRGTTYRYRYGYSGYPSCYYRGWQRSGRYCSGKSCQQYCSSGRCYCRSGYRASGSRCYDIDECSSNGGRGPCQTRCHNRVGSYYCSCNYGYYVCSTTRCCPVNCGRPKVPTSCPSYSFKDSQSLTPCKPLPYQSHCSTVYPNSCNLRCPTYYSIATYSASGTFMKNWNSISVIGKSYNIRCQGNSRWTVASTISRFYCRRDNDPPEWLRISSTTINEHSPVGTVVGYLTTYDPNKYDTHVFTVRPSSAAIFFSVVGNRLVVTFVPKFNQHQGITGDGNSFTITVRVTDRGSPAMYRDQSFTIRILDANEPPERLHLSNMAVKENVKVDSTVGVFSAYDPDLPSSTNPCTWAVTGFNSGFFKVSGNKLLVAKSLNFEAQNNHPLQISCTDFGRPAATTTATFVIDVQDAQEPPITLTINNAQVDEDAKAGQVVGMLTGLDQDQEKLIIAIVGGQVPITAGGSSLTRFGVSSTTCANVPAHDQVKARTKCSANLIVQPKILGAAAGSAGALDFETGGWFQVVFFARDASHPSLHKSLYVNITINDVNEAPTDISILNLTIPETAPGGALVSSLVVTDPDNSQRVVQRPTCTLVPGGDDAYFGITGESPNMELELAQTTMLDYEVKPVYRISVTCNDHGLPPKTITRSFVVNVQDENEAPLNITLSNNRVKEDAPVGTVVGMFSTIDPDVGDSFTYKFAPGFSTAAPFTVNKGRLMTTGKLDYEKNDSYVIDVSSTDQGGLEAIETFVVWVQDVPEPPTDLILDGNHTLPENSSDIAFIGNLIVTDQDVNQDPSCKVTGGIDMQYFSTAGDNGLELVSTAAGSMLDYETMGSDKNLQVEVTCTDLDGLGIKRPFTVRVTDVNEPPTDITLTPSSVKEAQPAGTLVGSLSVTDPDVGQAHNCSVIDTQPQAGQPLLTSLFYVKNQMLYTKKPLDFEATLAYSVEVECSDIPTDGQPSITFDKPIIVTLLDVNEVPGTPCAAFSIGEKKPDGTMVAMLNASDPDNEFSDKQVLTYTVVNSVPFKVDPSTNTLVKNGMLNFEVKKSYNVDIKVTDDGTIQTGNTTFKKVTPLSKTYTCVVNVLDNNDPHVSASIRLVPSNASVTEHAAAGTVIAKAFTDDVDASAKHTYKILETDVPFTMVGSDVTVTASGLLVDFEANSDDIKITIASTDEHNHTATRVFDIVINDYNEHPTAVCLLGTTVAENQPAGYQIGQLVVEDPDYPQRSCSPIQPHLELPIDDTCVIIDQTPGQIYTSRFEITSKLALVQKVPLNYEQYTFYDLRVACRDLNQPLNIISNTFTITVTNKNEAPNNLTVDATAPDNMQYVMVNPKLFQVFVPEHVYNVPVLNFVVSDPDSTKHALVTYSVSGLNVAGTFEVRNNELYLLKPLDHEGGKQYTLQVTVQDQGSPPLTAKITVMVNITDNPDKPTQVHLECAGGALFDLESPSRTRRQASSSQNSTTAPATQQLPTLPPAQLQPGKWGSSADCSILTDSMVKTGYLIGKIFPADQDVYKWYNFTLSGPMSDLFELAPYGATQGDAWQAAWLRLSKKAGDTAQSRFDFTRGNPSYRLRIDVVDQWGMHEIGEYLTIKTRDACHLGQKFCSAIANCTLDMSVSSGYTCQCPQHYIGNGISASSGCTMCAPGETVMGGKCVNINECDPMPCMNGATCVDGIYDFTCQCSAAYTGENCETHLKTCAIQTGICQNGGKCVDTKDDILCQCPTGYMGYYCEIQSAACSSFPSMCEQKTTAAFCASTPASNGEGSTPICVGSFEVEHIILESPCVPSTGVLDATYNHRATQYIEDVLNEPELHQEQDFCKYHTAQAQSAGSGITVTGRKKRATSPLGRQYLVQGQQSLFLKDGKAMHTVVVLDSSAGFKALRRADTCFKLQPAKYLQCMAYTDCVNSSAVLGKAGFKCGQSEYHSSLQEHVLPQYYIEIAPLPADATKPPCESNCNVVINIPNSPNANKQYTPASGEAFYKTTPGIVIIVAVCLVAFAIVIVVIRFFSTKKKIAGRYDERLLHSNYDGASASASQTSLGDFRSKFAETNRGTATGVTNPVYEATGGQIQAVSGIHECENALYESPDAIREMGEDMDN